MEQRIYGIDKIMSFLSVYLFVGNIVMVLLVLKIRRIHSSITTYVDRHNSEYHSIYNYQTAYIAIAIIKLLIYAILVTLFLINIDILYQLTSCLNLEPLLCDRETLSDYENELPNDLS